MDNKIIKELTEHKKTVFNKLASEPFTDDPGSKLKEINSLFAYFKSKSALTAKYKGEYSQIITETLQETKEILNRSALKIEAINKSSSIIIVTYNSMKTLDECISSALRYSGKNDEIIIVDNNSQDGTKDFLKTINNERLKIIFSDTNLGFSAGTNAGIKIASKDIIVLLNPDTVVTEFWLEKFVNHLYSAENIAAVGPLADYTIPNQHIIAYTNSFITDTKKSTFNYEDISRYTYFLHQGESRETKLLIGFCLAVKKDILDKIGYLDNDLFLGNDDLELSWRLREHGYRLKIALDTFIHHEGQVSFKTEKASKTDALVQESTDRLAEKLVQYYGFGQVPTPAILWNIGWFSPDPKKFSNMFKEIDLIEDNFNAREVAGFISKTMATPETKVLEVTENNFNQAADFDYLLFNDNSAAFLTQTNYSEKVVIICLKKNNPVSNEINQLFSTNKLNLIYRTEYLHYSLFVFSGELYNKEAGIKPLISVCMPVTGTRELVINTIAAWNKSLNIEKKLVEIILVESETTNFASHDFSNSEIPVKYFSNNENDFGIAIENAGSELILLVNSHSLPDPALIEKHIKYQAVAARYDYAILGNCFLDDTEQPKLKKILMSLSDKFRQNKFEKNYLYNNAIDFIANNLSITKEAILKAGNFTKRYEVNNYIDLELGLKLNKANYKVLYLDDLPLFDQKSYKLSDLVLEKEERNYWSIWLTDKYPEFREELFPQGLKEPEIEHQYKMLAVLKNIGSHYNFENNPAAINMLMGKLAVDYGYYRGVARGGNDFLNFRINMEEAEKPPLNQQPLVSIIMPAYNDEDDIGYSIESVINQAYTNWELIIIDDGSLDKTGLSVQAYADKDPRIKYYYQQNTGVAAARNRGIILSTGKYIKFSDSDDILLPNGLETLVRGFDSASENTKLVYGDFINGYTSTGNYKLNRMALPSVPPQLFRTQLVGNIVPVGSALLDREAVIKSGMMDEVLNGTDDFDLWNRIMLSYDIKKIDQCPIYIQCIHSEQLSLDLESLKCYTDFSCLKLLHKLSLAALFTDVKDNNPEALAENYETLAANMLDRVDMPSDAIIEVLRFAQNISFAKNREDKVKRVVNINNQRAQELFTAFFEVPKISRNSIEEIKNAFVRSSVTRNKVVKLFFSDHDKNKIYSDIYDYNNFYLEYQSAKVNEGHGHLVVSHDWYYGALPEKWVSYFNKIIDQVWVNNNFIKENYIASGVFAGKIKVIPSVINTDLYNPGAEPLKINTNKNFKFFCISKFSENSGIDLLLEAYYEEFSGNDDVSLVIMNDFIYDFKKYQQVAQRISSANGQGPEVILQRNTMFKEELTGAFTAADCYIYPYKSEKTGIHILEAMSCGLPVITTGGGPALDYCNHGNAYLVNAELVEKENLELELFDLVGDIVCFEPDKQHLKKLMRTVLKDPADAQGKGRKGRKTVINTHTWALVSEKVEKCLTGLQNEVVFRFNLEQIKKDLLKNGLESYQNKAYSEAENDFYKLSCLEDSNCDYLYNLGLSRFMLEKYEEAVDSFARSLEMGMVTYDICYYLARSLENSGDSETASLYFAKAEELKL
jgi:GT2 family glycosyltransferase/glycosyltransferase involved in cell wall biosynthesis